MDEDLLKTGLELSLIEAEKALEAGKEVLDKYNPENSYLFTSLEPCFGCGFFVIRSNIKTIAWCDLWIGVFVDSKKKKLYLCPLPTLLFTIYYGN